MSRLIKRALVGVASAALVVPLALVNGGPAVASPVQRGDAVGLVGGVILVKFKVGDPAGAQQVGRLRGLVEDTELVGIDRRIQNNRVYGVGNAGGVYIINGSAQVRLINRLGVPLEGNEFGVDFNPAADRLRIISDTGQNLRHDITGTQDPVTAVDAPLSYPATATSPAIEPARGVTAAAYTNNDLRDDTGTTLFVLDTERDQLATQSPANAGILQNNGRLSTPFPANATFDIGDGNRAYAVLRGSQGVRLVRVNLLNGDLTRIGFFPRSRASVSDIALPLASR